MPLIVEDTSEINVPPRVSTLCLPEYRLHLTSSSRPSSILHIKVCPCFKLSVWSLLILHMVNLLQTEQNSTTVYMCAPKYLSTVCVALKIRLIVYTYVPCFSFLGWFTSSLYFSSPVFFRVDHSGGLPVDSGEDL